MLHGGSCMSLALEQAVAGFRINEGTSTVCNQCGITLTERSPLTIRLRKKDDCWNILERYCVGCASASFDSLPTTSGIEVLVEGRLGVAQDALTQRTWLTLVAPVVVEMVRPTHLISHL